MKVCIVGKRLKATGYFDGDSNKLPKFFQNDLMHCSHVHDTTIIQVGFNWEVNAVAM